MTRRLTVVVLVRDEPRRLAAFIDALDGRWDELVAVDVSGHAPTRERLARAGARVIDCEWRRDLSHARNVGLACATGDWVLVLDPDDEPSPGLFEQLREAMLRPEVGALELRVTELLPYGHRRERLQLRAFRQHPSIFFEHPARESLERTVTAFLSAKHLERGRLEALLLHHGLVADRDAAERAKRRDVELLRERLTLDPGDFACWLRLLDVARTWQDDVLWREAAREATDVLETLGRELLDGVPWGGELVAAIAEGLFAPDSDAGLRFLEGWADRLVPCPAFALRLGFFLESQGHGGEARSHYLAALASDGDPQQTRVAPRLGLARLELARNDAPAALLHARLALEAGPREPEALLAVASLTRRVEGREAFDAWRDAHEPSPEFDWAVGEALLASSQAPAAVAAFRRAAGVPPSGPAGLRLAQALLAAGQSEPAEKLSRQLLATQPEAGLGVLLFDLAAGRDTDLDLELSPETAHAAFKQWLDALLLSRERTLVRKVRSRLAAVEPIFPWATGYLRRRSA